MAEPLAVLVVDDDARRVQTLLDALAAGGYAPQPRVVTDAAMLQQALDDPRWQLVLAAWSLGAFSAMAAYRQMRQRGIDLPFVVVDDHADEAAAVEAMRAGIHDFVASSRLGRLAPAVGRALAEAAGRRQRRLAEAELQHKRRQSEQTERLLRLIIESVPDAVVVVDERGEYLLWNRAAEPIVRTLLGDPGDGGPRPGFFHAEHNRPMHGLAERLQEVAAGDPLERLELYLRHPAFGEGRWFSVGARPLRDAGGSAHGAVAVFHDITAQRDAQEQLMISDRLASLGMLAAGIAHEINNPMAAVLANLSLAQGSLATAEPDIAALTAQLGDAHDAAERVRRIVRDLRVFSREEEPQPVTVDLNQVLDASLRIARHQLSGRAALVTELMPDAFVAGDESRLGQVFLNLIVNAAQAIPEGDAEHHRIIVRTYRESEDCIAAEISDTGSGMSAEVRDQLFKPFFTTKAAGVGTGLGLAICQRIVAALHGRIEVESEPGAGSTFRVVLPIATAPVAAAPAPALAATSSHPARVLVIDDEPLIGNAVAAILGSVHEVVTLTEAEHALALLDAGEHFDLILCDLVMPGMGGIELHRELQQLHPAAAARTWFLTGGAFTEHSRDFLRSVPGRVIDKPFEPQRLFDAVDAALRQAGPAPDGPAMPA